jgi:hypothetical protein
MFRTYQIKLPKLNLIAAKPRKRTFKGYSPLNIITKPTETDFMPGEW